MSQDLVLTIECAPREVQAQTEAMQAEFERAGATGDISVSVYQVFNPLGVPWPYGEGEYQPAGRVLVVASTQIECDQHLLAARQYEENSGSVRRALAAAGNPDERLALSAEAAAIETEYSETEESRQADETN